MGCCRWALILVPTALWSGAGLGHETGESRSRSSGTISYHGSFCGLERRDKSANAIRKERGKEWAARGIKALSRIAAVSTFDWPMSLIRKVAADCGGVCGGSTREWSQIIGETKKIRPMRIPPAPPQSCCRPCHRAPPPASCAEPRDRLRPRVTVVTARRETQARQDCLLVGRQAGVGCLRQHRGRRFRRRFVIPALHVAGPVVKARRHRVAIHGLRPAHSARIRQPEGLALTAGAEDLMERPLRGRAHQCRFDHPGPA